MSKIVVLDERNFSIGQFDAIAQSLAWSLNGHPNVSGGGSSQIVIADEIAGQKWLNFGRMVVVIPEDLEPYIGMIDTPWSAMPPVQITIYDPEYLLNIRVAENAPVKYTGDVSAIISQIIDTANANEDIYLRLGIVQGVDATNREETLDGRTLWEQVKALLQRSGTEMKIRPAQGPDKRWYIYLDISKSMGVDTEFLLSDGEQGNMKIRSAVVRGEIVNRVIGISSQSSAASRLQTYPIENVTSKNMYRMRNKFLQFRDVTDGNTLIANAQNFLSASSKPYLELSVDVINVNHGFLNLRLGNKLMTHAPNVRLPGGVRGWRGKTRITKMAFTEATKTITMTLIGDL